MHARIAITVTAVLLLSCAPGAGEAEDASVDLRQVTLTSFADGAWLFTVDREWDRSASSVQFPTDALPESAYVPVPGTTLPVVVSSAGARVTIGTESPLIGTRTHEDDDDVVYDLTDSTFAGGRFWVWADAKGLQAELTIYGSGLPIVQSRRGALVRE